MVPRSAALLLAASAATLSTASNMPRDSISDVPQTRLGRHANVFHGALENAANVAPPEPTTPPSHPRFAAMGLVEREEVLANTCGYFVSTGVTGPYFDWFMCANSQAVCTTSGTIRQCCHTTECSTTTFGTTCLDYSACPSSHDDNTYCCAYTTAQPYCSSFLWSTPGGDTFTFFGCGEDDTSRVQFMYASTEGVDLGVSSTRRGSATAATTRASATSNRSPASAPTTDSDSDSSGRASSTAEPSRGNSAPIGAIVGGVVGGLAVIALLVLGVFFIVRRSRKSNNSNNSNNPNNPSVLPFMAQNPQQPPHIPGPQHSPPPFSNAAAYNGAVSPYTTHSNPHHSVYSTVGAIPVSQTPSAQGGSPHHMNAWAAPPPPGSPPPAWAPHGQTPPPPPQWEASKDSAMEPSSPPTTNMQELGSTNPVGQYGGNNRAELG